VKLKPTTEKTLIDCLAITLAIFIPYHQVAQHTFTDYDDNGYLFQNNHINIGLTWDNIGWAFTTTEMANWHPLTWISHLIDRELFGIHPGGYLLMNVAWHMLAACLAYLAFLHCTKSRLFALTVALIFALHPVNVENVAWASERKSILNAVFWFAALISYLRFIETKSFKAYGLTVIFFILSLFSKAMSVTLPCTLMLIHCLYFVYHPDQRRLPERLRQEWKSIILPACSLLILSLYFSVVTMSAQSIAMNENIDLSDRVINALISHQRYLGMFFHPTQLALFYPLRSENPLLWGSTVPALLLLFALSVVALLLARKKPQLVIGWAWFLGTMVPVIGLVQVGGQSHADRYLYIPLLGLAFVFPVLFEMLGSLGVWFKKSLISYSLMILAVSMLAATQIQVSYWQDGVSICRHSLAVTGYCFNPVVSLSITYTRTGRFDELFAMLDSYIALEDNPWNKGILATIKANVLYTMGRHQAAADSVQKALSWGFTNKVSYALAALSFYELGQTNQAILYLAKAKVAPELQMQNSLLAFPLREKLTWLDLRLEEKITPKPNL